VKDWQGYALAIFGVAAGQVLRLGRKIEAGERVGLRDLYVLVSMLPAFGALIGAAGTHYGLPIWASLTLSISAGWVGFGAMRVVLAAARSFVAQLMPPSGIKPD